VSILTVLDSKILCLRIGSKKNLPGKKKAGDEGHRLSVSIAGNIEKNEK